MWLENWDRTSFSFRIFGSLSWISLYINNFFTVNLAFANYFDIWTNSLETLVLISWTTNEQILPISLADFPLKPDLLKVSKILKEIIHQIENREDIFQLYQKQVKMDLDLDKANKKFFVKNSKMDCTQ